MRRRSTWTRAIPQYPEGKKGLASETAISQLLRVLDSIPGMAEALNIPEPLVQEILPLIDSVADRIEVYMFGRQSLLNRQQEFR